MARRQPPRARARGRRRGLHLPPRLAAQASRRGLGRRVVADRVRRAWRDAGRAGDLQRGVRPRAGAQRRQRPRPGDGRPDRHRPRHRGAEAPLPRADPVGRGDLVPGLLRARLGLGPRLGQDEGRARRRRLARHRPEGVDHAGPPRQVVHARRAHRSRRAQAPGAQLLPHGHGAGRRPGPPSAPDHRRGRVQRALHGGGADPRTPTSSAGRATAGRWPSRRSCTSAPRWPSGSRSRSSSRCASSWTSRARTARAATRSSATASPSSTSSPRSCG